MSTLNTEEQQILYLIKTDLDQARYFFSRVKSLKWFDPLMKQKYFSPDNIPFNAEGRTLFWDVLDYLERVSEQVAENHQYAKELINIIGDIIQFSCNKKKINNYHIWWFCVKILNNIPNSIIKENLSIEDQNINGQLKSGFKTWLNEFLDPSQSSILAISDVSEKLLPKFMQDTTMVPFSEAIVEAITRIKPRGKKNPFTKEDETDLVWDEHWILKAVQKHGKDIGVKCSNVVIYTIADRLKTALQYVRRSFYVNLEINGQKYQLKVERIPRDNLKPLEIGFKDNEFEGYILQYEENQLKGIDESDYWSLHKIDPSIEIKSFRFVAEDRKSFTEFFKQQLPQDIDWGKAEDFENKINGLFGGVSEDYSSVWCKSLSSGPEHSQGTEEVLTIALRDVLLGKCETDPKQAEIVLKNFLTQKYPFPIFRKCVLVCINEDWNNFKHLFEQFLNDLPSSLHTSTYEIELHDIFKKHNLNFRPELNQWLTKFINDVPEYYIQEGEAAAAYWKYKWLSSLKDNPVFGDAYKENKEKAKLLEDKPYQPQRSSTMAGFVKHVSPLTKEEILSQENLYLVKYLDEYQGADEWSGSFEGKPDKEGLKDALQQAVKEKPEKFYNDLSLFGQCHYEYVSRILWGLKDAWVAGQPIGWGTLFDFCADYLKRKNFIEQAKQAQGEDFIKGRHLWAIDIISDLIETGSRQDERAFDAVFFPKVYPIFDLMYDLVEGDKKPDTQRDAVTYAINTSLGHVIESFIVFSLRVARVEKKTEQAWGQNKYERFFEKGIEAYIFLGRYLPQIKYLDERFAKDKIDILAQRNADDCEWQVFMEAYLTGPGIYKDLYQWMRLHYIKAIEYKVLNENVDRRMVQHITVGYLRGYELFPSKDNQDSLFWKLLNEASTPEKRDRWSEAATFMWSVTGRPLTRDIKDEEKSSEEVKKKVLNFWGWVHSPESFAKDKLGEKYNSFLGDLARFAVLLEKIDDASEKWLMASADHLEEYDTFFIEYLARFEDEESVKRIGKIFIKVLEVTTPIYKQEDIQLIVQRIYDTGNREDAEKICATYGRRGQHFLKSVWERNQRK